MDNVVLSLDEPRAHDPIALATIRERWKSEPSRKCGGCTVCCDTLVIPELRKPFGQKCPHSCAIGCQIYAVRPNSCKSFKCAWLMGYGDEEDRPDKSDALAEFKFGPLGEQLYGLIIRRHEKSLKALNTISEMANIDVVIGD